MSDTIRLFISIPMSGRSEKEILEQMDREENRAMAYFAKRGINIVMYNSYINQDYVDEVQFRNNDVYMLSKSIEVLAYADTIWMGEGWQKSRGCQVEHKIATEYYLGRYYSELVEEELC